MLSKLKIISLIGRSGSGKTNLIINAIKRLRKELHYNIAVIKNIHEHQIDEEGKDSYKYIEAGANYAITKNICLVCYNYCDTNGDCHPDPLSGNR